MTKPEWGEKRTCPKCGARFYDLGKNDPASCIECGTNWVPEPILKTKQPISRDEPVVEEKKDKDEDDLDTDDLDIPADLDVDDEDDDEDEADDVLVDVSLDDEDSDVNDIIDVSLVKGDE